MNKLSALVMCIGMFFCACTPLPPISHFEGAGLGTYYKISISGNNSISISQIDSIIDVLNNTASIFNPHSLVSRINRNETDTLNEILKHILEVSLQVCEDTQGAYDFTVGALVNLWGFGKDAQKDITQDEVDKALATVGYKKICIVGNRVVKENPSTQLNFNAIAKGYGVDMVAAFLKEQGIVNFLVDIGGELYVSGRRAPTKMWRVGIQKPTGNKEGEIAAEEVMKLADVGVATSGNYRNYKEKNGKRYGHIINPHTGYPENTTLLSATILASTCAIADGYATACMVLGAENAAQFVERKETIKGYFVMRPE